MTASAPISVENEQPVLPGAPRVCCIHVCNAAMMDCASPGGTHHFTVIRTVPNSILTCSFCEVVSLMRRWEQRPCQRAAKLILRAWQRAGKADDRPGSEALEGLQYLGGQTMWCLMAY